MLERSASTTASIHPHISYCFKLSADTNYTTADRKTYFLSDSQHGMNTKYQTSVITMALSMPSSQPFISERKILLPLGFTHSDHFDKTSQFLRSVGVGIVTPSLPHPPAREDIKPATMLIIKPILCVLLLTPFTFP
ncbi:hypothetical protein CDAR_168761 [Caerostris darwini]|uniref:Uncharacterized protein n=1 Tax=Caerostris darwini TaxID=1538125 RepID=A0AAV4WQG5_9ARAC|nr:hypothetical protein CDAR_168761 [Caerostris darwini]